MTNSNNNLFVDRMPSFIGDDNIPPFTGDESVPSFIGDDSMPSFTGDDSNNSSSSMASPGPSNNFDSMSNYNHVASNNTGVAGAGRYYTITQVKSKFIKKYQTETESWEVNFHPNQSEIQQRGLLDTMVRIFNDILDRLTYDIECH